MVRPCRGSNIPNSLQPIMPCLICRLPQNYLTYNYFTVCKPVGSLSRGLKIARLYKRDISGIGLPCYPELNLLRSISFNKRSVSFNKTRKHFSRHIHGARMFPQCFPVSYKLFPVSVSCFQDANYAYAIRQGNLTKIRACEHEQASTHLIFASNSSKGQTFASTFKLDGTSRYPYCSWPPSPRWG